MEEIKKEEVSQEAKAEVKVEEVVAEEVQVANVKADEEKNKLLSEKNKLIALGIGCVACVGLLAVGVYAAVNSRR